MGSESARLPPFAPRNASAGVFWVQLQHAANANGVDRVQQQYPPAADGTTTAAVDHAAMAIHAQ